jgi:hypothetical protein
MLIYLKDFKADNELKAKPFYLTGSWMVRGDEQYDYVSISLMKNSLIKASNKLILPELSSIFLELPAIPTGSLNALRQRR